MMLDAYIKDSIREVVREEIRPLLQAYMQRAANDDRRVSRTQAAAAAGVSPATIKTWVEKGRLTQYGEGRSITYSLMEVMSLRPANEPVQQPDADAKAEAILARGRKHG